MVTKPRKGVYLKHLDDFFKGFKAIEIRGSDVLEYVAKRSDDLVEANEKLEAFLAEAVKESKIEKLKE
jgi:hypothetical protein